MGWPRRRLMQGCLALLQQGPPRTSRPAMQQYYTLEEAAQKLNMSVDELREMAKKKQIRAFQDRGNWRFRAQEIDEKARQLGVNSDPEVQLGDSGKSPRPVPRKPGDSDASKSPRPQPRKPSESDAVDLGK